jgi:transcriptional regulator with XRE-family HTH domain
MTTAEELFEAEGDRLRSDVDYVTEGFYLDIAENISKAMTRARMKNKDLAQAMNVTPGRVTNLLRGYSRNLEIRTIAQVALAVGVEPHDLCARRKTHEMVTLWKTPQGFQNARIAPDTHAGKENQNGEKIPA